LRRFRFTNYSRIGKPKSPRAELAIYTAIAPDGAELTMDSQFDYGPTAYMYVYQYGGRWTATAVRDGHAWGVRGAASKWVDARKVS
jgi:hypothetical protein